ncbi:MAG TPA: glycosyltransferase family 4 protein [Chitinophagaceae bacterium]|nr:glycosyltransferase family 4 protein [Chitinophagaceae bacterium]
MRIVSASYTNTPSFNDPDVWLDRIGFYTGILEELAKQHDVQSIEQINYAGKLKRNGVLYHFLNFKKRKQYFPLKLHNYIKKIGPDIVFVNGFIFPLQIIQLKLKLGRSVQIIVLHRAERPFKGIKRYLQKLADKCVNAYLFSSAEFGKLWMEKGIISDSRKIHEVMQASSTFKPANKAEARSFLSISGSPVYLWVGRLDANKDPVTVVKAFKDFLKFQPLAHLYMIYQLNDLLQEVKELIGEVNKVCLIGKADHNYLQYWYNSADFFISGSHYEGSGIAACEAMSCGCIPILTDIFSFRRMTGPAKCGLLYEAGNEKELLNSLLQSKEMDIQKEREKVLEQFKKELSFEAIAGKINILISSLSSQVSFKAE